MKLFWHVAAMGAWREIVMDQLLCLRLGYWPENEAVIATIAGDGEDLRYLEAAAAAAGISIVVVQQSRVSDFEFPAIFAVEAYCRRGVTGDEAIGYFHTKGASKPGDKCAHYWRLAMQRACLIEWRDRVAELNRGAAASGLTWHTWNGRSFYAGNFWWFWRSQLQRLPDLSAYRRNWNCKTVPWENNDRHAAEFWLGEDLTGDRRSVWPGAQVSHWQWWVDRPEAILWSLKRPLISIARNNLSLAPRSFFAAESAAHELTCKSRFYFLRLRLLV